jgi:hypothetical protein
VRSCEGLLVADVLHLCFGGVDIRWIAWRH